MTKDQLLLELRVIAANFSIHGSFRHAAKKTDALLKDYFNDEEIWAVYQTIPKEYDIPEMEYGPDEVRVLSGRAAGSILRLTGLGGHQ